MPEYLPENTNDELQLRETILAVIEGTASSRQLNSLIAVSHTFAESYLRSRRAAWHLMEFHDMSRSDLAYDCLAELFRKDENGRLIELHTYFAGYEVRTADNVELVAYLRRLIFSKVNNRLFAMVGESDTVLARIVRNIKISLRAMKHFTEIERFGEVFLCPVDCDPLEENPKFSADEIEQLCFEHILDVTNIPQLLAKLSLVVRRQTDRSRMFPLFVLASVIKSVTGKQLPAGDSSDGFMRAIDEGDALQTIRSACNTARTKFTMSYVQKGKLSDAVLTHYLMTVEEFLIARVVEQDGEGTSLFSLLGKRLPELTEREYRATHKAKLEYVTRFVYECIEKDLKD
ncbi:MAG: hypothetical protein HY961_14530 [Ignavibacteriae bacterium]|nr:hypothetical protein [Ignavibacteriota bacterium]